MQIITLSAETSQKVSIQLGGSSCSLQLTQRTTGLYIDVFVGTTAVCLGVLCLNGNKIIRSEYLRASTGFSGDLFFIDTQGSDDPEWSELGSRYLLYYATADEI